MRRRSDFEAGSYPAGETQLQHVDDRTLMSIAARY